MSPKALNPFRHEPIKFHDQHGRACYRVPLDRHGRQYALVTVSDFNRVRESGATGVWYLDTNGCGKHYVRTCVPTRRSQNAAVMPARIISGARPKSVVRYVNGDTLDLRPENLVLHRGKSKRTDTAMAERGASLRANQ
jgi:hypothetical protein